MSLTRPRLIGLAVAATIFALDQLLKWLMIVPLALREVQVIPLLPIFDLRWTVPTGQGPWWCGKPACPRNPGCYCSA